MPLKDADAYWISPDGALVIVTDTHIKTVLEKPEAFGLTFGYLEDVYHDTNETLGDEGRARDLIIDDLTKGGWIRIRYYPEDDNYLIQLGRLGQSEADFLQDWAGQLIESNRNRAFANVVIEESSVGYNHNFTSVEAVANDYLYKGLASGLHRKRIQILNSVKDL